MLMEISRAVLKAYHKEQPRRERTRKLVMPEAALEKVYILGCWKEWGKCNE